MEAHGVYSQEMDRIKKPHEGRVDSGDALRGFTMFMLIGQGFGLLRLHDYLCYWLYKKRSFSEYKKIDIIKVSKFKEK